MRLFYEQQRPAWINHQRQLDFPLHLHDAVEIVYVLKGSSTVICDGGRLSLGPGDLFLSFPNQAHGYENTTDFDGYLMIASTPTLSGCRSVLEQRQPAEPVVHLTGPEADAIVSLLQMMRADRDTASISLLQSYSLLLLNKLLTVTRLVPRSVNTNALQSVLRYVSEHYQEPVTRQEIAKAVGYSVSHISHLFAEVLHMSLTDYVTMLRMDDARALLRQTDLPIGQIALSLGFSSIRSFNRFFNLRMRMTPSAYRAQKQMQ